MKKLIIGILAHVDAGKTTLAESLLYTCGTIRKAGRVDHGDAFLDNGDMERKIPNVYIFMGMIITTDMFVINIGQFLRIIR